MDECGVIINNTMFYKLDVLDIKDDGYLISKDGQIYSLKFKRILKHNKDKDGYHCIHLRGNGGKEKYIRIALLMLYKFVGNPPSNMTDPTSQHIDGNINNNNIDNLMWMERSENSSKRLNTGKGEQNHEAVLTEKQVIEIAELLQTNQYSLQEIADKYYVHKTTVSNIKRKKAWTYLLKDYEFPKSKYLGYKEQRRQLFFSFFQKGYTVQDVVSMGYSYMSAHRWFKKFEMNNEINVI